MTSLLANRTTRRRGMAFAILLVISSLLMAFSSNPAVREVQNGVSFAFRPIQGAVDDVAEGISSLFAAITDIDRLNSDNTALRRENERLTADNLRLQEQERENEHLTGLLQLRNSLSYQTAAAEVIARDSSEFKRVVTISKGEDAGIEEGDVVVAEGGALAGRVVEVGGNYAKVVLISDQSSTVIGQLPTSGATGEVVGQLEGAIVMTNIDSTEQVEIGEEVVTAGIELAGGIRSPYPKGLILGTVIDVRRDANSIVQTAYLQPTANLDKLEYVLVLLDYEGGLPPADDQPIDCSLTGEDGTVPAGEQPCIEPTPSPAPSVASPSPSGPLLP